jgi:hypothetical protein
MCKYSILFIDFRQASYLLAAGVFVIMANASIALCKPTEQLASNSTEQVTPVLNRPGIAGGIFV